jgi:hypothetical protein
MDFSRRKTTDGVARVSVERPEGSRYTAITPNWCDKTTWYWDSEKKTGQVLDHVSGYTVYESPTEGAVWVDNYHGKYSNEDFLLNHDGQVPRLKVYVNDVEKTEQDPHTGSGGDYTVDYTLARVTFLSALTDTDVVKVDVWEVGSSTWNLVPETGKKLKITTSEVQFSKDILIKDTVLFQPEGPVEIFAPELCPDPYPAGTYIPLGNPVVYKTMLDFVNEANGSMPLIPSTTGTPKSWRDLQEDVVVYPWNYQAVTEVDYPVRIAVSLQHDVELGGTVATATFYCLSYSM